jgi:putative MATE family efflux protein
LFTYKHIRSISYPIFLSLLAQNIINVTDTAFLGRIGEIELGASALGGLAYICMFTLAFGFSAGAQILIARRNGERAFERTGAIMLQGILFLAAMAVILFALVRLCGEPLMSLLVSSGTIREAAVSFLDIRAYGFFFAFPSVMFRAFFVGITRTRVLTANAILMAGVNILLDYLLIFGHAGFPAMGLTGAAIASVAAEAISILFFILYVRRTVETKTYGLNRIRAVDFRLLAKILSISIYMMLQYFISMSTFLFFFIAVERIGQRELAVANIARSIYVVLFIPVSALSTTANTLVSNAIGAGRSNCVGAILTRIACLSLAIMTGFAAIFCLLPRAILSIYTNSPALIADAVPSIYVISAAMLISAVGSVVFNGVSGTGNTRTALLFELVTLAIYCLYVYLVAIQWKEPVHVCFTSEIVYYGLLLLLSLLYIRRGSWKNKRI